MTEVNLTEEQARLFANAVLQPNGCRLWRGGKSAKGYETVLFRGKTWRVHLSRTAGRALLSSGKTGE